MFRMKVRILLQDRKVLKDAFEHGLTLEIFSGYVMTLLMSLLLERQDNCKPLLTMIAHSIY